MARPEAQAQALAQQHAPILVMHPEDPWPPCDPLRLIGGSELCFSDADRETALAPKGGVSAERLGAQAAASAYSATPQGGSPLLAWQFTRPFDKSNARVRGLGEGTGFVLKLDAEPAPAPLSEVPMFYEWRDDATLIYWFCMSGSSLPDAAVGAIEGALNVLAPGSAPAPRSSAAAVSGAVSGAVEAARGLIPASRPDLLPAAKAAGGLLAGVDRLYEVHEGDWEGMTVRYSGDQPASIELHQHGRAAPIAPGDLAHDGDRPIVYSGRGTHATVGTPATAGPEEVAADGPRWEPAPELVLDATAQPWYGFGGAWGRRRRPPLGDLDGTLRTLVRWVSGYDVWEESTGPLGPSIYKLR